MNHNDLVLKKLENQSKIHWADFEWNSDFTSALLAQMEKDGVLESIVDDERRTVYRLKTADTMKLFIHDEKHDTVNGEFDLGALDSEKRELVNKIIEFLDTTDMTTRYHRLVLAKGYKIVVDEESGESEVVFS